MSSRSSCSSSTTSTLARGSRRRLSLNRRLVRVAPLLGPRLHFLGQGWLPPPNRGNATRAAQGWREFVRALSAPPGEDPGQRSASGRECPWWAARIVGERIRPELSLPRGIDGEEPEPDDVGGPHARVVDPLRHHHLAPRAIERDVHEPLALAPPLVAERDVHPRDAPEVDGDAPDEELVLGRRATGDGLAAPRAGTSGSAGRAPRGDRRRTERPRPGTGPPR